MFKIVLLLFFGTCSTLSYSQNKNSFNYKIEDFRNDNEYLVEDSLLVRFNGGSTNKKTKKNFESLKSCGIDVNYWYAMVNEQPEEFNAFGQPFTFQKTTNDTRVYMSEEVDSEVHFITFFYDNNRDVAVLRKIEIEAKNVRSEEMYMKYIYQFWKPR